MNEELHRDMFRLLDFCADLAQEIRGNYTDPRDECKAIADACDLAYALGGDESARAPWIYAKNYCQHHLLNSGQEIDRDLAADVLELIGKGAASL